MILGKSRLLGVKKAIFILNNPLLAYNLIAKDYTQAENSQCLNNKQQALSKGFCLLFKALYLVRFIELEYYARAIRIRIAIAIIPTPMPTPEPVATGNIGATGLQQYPVRTFIFTPLI